MDNPLFTADFQPAEAEAGMSNVTGVIRIYPLETEGTAGISQPAPPTGVQPGETQPGETQPGETEGAQPEAGTTEGAATATPSEGRGFRLEVTLDGLQQGEHAWHIHSGPCGEEAPVAVAITSTGDQQGLGQPLNVTSEGSSVRSEVEVPADELTIEQLQSGQYSVHVHQNGGVDHGPTVACADLGAGAATGDMGM
jgi:Cu/Zn superoxide dismutase